MTKEEKDKILADLKASIDAWTKVVQEFIEWNKQAKPQPPKDDV